MLIFSCSKSNSKSNSVGLKSHDGTNYWKLVERDWGVALYNNAAKPSSDSPVELVLAADSTYTSKLNGQAVCSGPYEITKDNLLQLHNFKPTGIFAQFEGYLQDSTGYLTLTFDGLYINIVNDTMRLSGPPIPSAYTDYIFIKE